CVLARKFANLHPFGCWWFNNVPYLIDETLRLRLELLGTSFTAQHSDARVLDQIIYKWDHTRRSLSSALTDKYADLALTGWEPTAAEVERDVHGLLGGAFEQFCKM
ncbi:MAG TPA: glucuronate isomerase, partial [Verrucomicrobiota bacterium]|nr:glucuronate isomerase [Verrucomicrobiota bacterium]